LAGLAELQLFFGEESSRGGNVARALVWTGFHGKAAPTALSRCTGKCPFSESNIQLECPGTCNSTQVSLPSQPRPLLRYLKLTVLVTVGVALRRGSGFRWCGCRGAGGPEYAKNDISTRCTLQRYSQARLSTTYGAAGPSSSASGPWAATKALLIMC
jgi:hypothetical protein